MSRLNCDGSVMAWNFMLNNPVRHREDIWHPAVDLQKPSITNEIEGVELDFQSLIITVNCNKRNFLIFLKFEIVII